MAEGSRRPVLVNEDVECRAREELLVPLQVEDVPATHLVYRAEFVTSLALDLGHPSKPPLGATHHEAARVVDVLGPLVRRRLWTSILA